MLHKTDTVNLMTSTLSRTRCFLQDRNFVRCSSTSCTCDGTCAIGNTLELLLGFFFNSLPMPAREWAISPPLCGPEVGNSKLPKREMSLSVPNFSGALLLSMRSFLQVTFFIDCKIKQTRNCHIRKQLRHNVRSNYQAKHSKPSIPQ